MARMPITVVADTPVEWAEPMPVHYAQPWDCSSSTTLCMFWIGLHHVLVGKDIKDFYPYKFIYCGLCESEIADDPAQHKQSHVLELLDACCGQEHSSVA